MYFPDTHCVNNKEWRCGGAGTRTGENSDIIEPRNNVLVSCRSALSLEMRRRWMVAKPNLSSQWIYQPVFCFIIQRHYYTRLSARSSLLPWPMIIIPVVDVVAIFLFWLFYKGCEFGRRQKFSRTREFFSLYSSSFVAWVRK